MNRSLFLVFLILLNVAFTGFSQSPAKTLSINPAPQKHSDPFKLENGSLFSASSKLSKKPQSSGISLEPVEIQRDDIALDFADALDVIKANYVDSKRVNYNDLTKSSISSMLRSLDPHSNYFDAMEYQDFLTDQKSEYVGIGCTIANYVSNGVTDTYVTSTYPDSSAFRAGLKFGDKIVAVDGEKMTGKYSYSVREKIRGQKGTSVRLLIERAIDNKYVTYEVKRNIVPQPSIPDAYLIRPGIGYIELSNGFNYTTYDELTAALGDLQEQGMTSLILDIRGNPGGILDQAVKVAGKFLQNGEVVVTQRGRFEIDNRTMRVANKTTENVPLVLLVDEGSASASEIVAGALQDHDRALIIGEKTFGKGLVQSIIDLPNSSGLTLTTAKYYTPSGRLIQRDYSNIGRYDYFNHKAKITQTLASKTVTGRLVYSGDGITPDELIKQNKFSTTEVNLLDSLFFFAREITNGRVASFENYKLTRPIQYGQRIRPSDFPATDDLLNAFHKFISTDKRVTISPEQFEAEKKFIITRLRFNLATAAFGNVAANQVLIENDVQVAKAVEALPRSQNLAIAARRLTQKQNK